MICMFYVHVSLLSFEQNAFHVGKMLTILKCIKFREFASLEIFNVAGGLHISAIQFAYVSLLVAYGSLLLERQKEVYDGSHNLLFVDRRFSCHCTLHFENQGKSF